MKTFNDYYPIPEKQTTIKELPLFADESNDETLYSLQARRESFNKTASFANSQQEKIFTALAQSDMTAREIELSLNLRRSSVCGRLVELQKANRIAQVGKKFDPQTGICVTLYGIKK